MKRRRHQGRAIRRVIMNHRSSGRARVGLLSNKCVPSRTGDEAPVELVGRTSLRIRLDKIVSLGGIQRQSGDGDEKMRGAKRGYHIFLHVGDGIRIQTGEERQGWRCRGQASWWAVEMVERRAHAAGDVVQQRGEPGRTRPNRIITFKTRADLTREVVRRTKRARGTSVWIHRPPREEYRAPGRSIPYETLYTYVPTSTDSGAAPLGRTWTTKAVHSSTRSDAQRHRHTLHAIRPLRPKEANSQSSRERGATTRVPPHA
eukprot:Gb_15379 [translate_table: standard]